MADEVIFKLIVDLGDSEKQVDAFQKKLEQLKKEMQSAFRDLKIDLPDFSGFGDGILPSISGIISKASSLFLSGFKSIFGGIVSLAQSAFSSIYNVGEMAFNKISDVVVDSVEVFATFEKKLGLVSKTTGLVEGDLKKLGDELREIARPIGSIKAENLLEIANVAGQLGIQGVENIKAFSKEIAYGVIALDKFKGSAEKLSLHMAKSINIYKLSEQETGRMLSTIDKLSKSTAANELEISNFNMQLGQFNTNLKLTYAQASALGATFVESGMQASKAATHYGSAYNSLIKGGKALASAEEALKAAAASGYDGIAQLEQITGESRNSFQTLGDMIQYSLGVNAFQTLNTLTGSLNNIPNTVDNINKGINSSTLGVEMFGAIGWKAMSILMDSMKEVNGEQGKFQKNLDIANKAFDEGTSHMESFQRATDNYNEKVGSIKSIWNDILLTIGEPAVGALNKILDNAIKIFNQFAAWVNKSESVNSALTSIAGAFQNIVNDHLVPLAQSMLEWITNSDAINNILENKIPSAMQVIQEWIGNIIDRVHEWFNYIIENSDTIWEGFKTALSGIIDFLLKVPEYMKKILEFMEKISPSLNLIVKGVVLLSDTIIGLFNIFDTRSETITGFFQYFTDSLYGVTDAEEKLNQKINETDVAINELGNDAVYNSVFPDMQISIAQTTEDIAILDGAIATMRDGVLILGESADQTFKDMAASAEIAVDTIDKLNIKQQQSISPAISSAKVAAESGFTSATPGNISEWKSVYSDLNDLMAKQKELYPAIESSAKASSTQIAKLANGVYANVPYMGILDDMQAGIGENAKEIEKLGYWTGKASDAIKIMGDEAVYNSVFPDISTAIKANESDLQSLSNTITNATGYLNSLGESANSAISKVNEIAASSLGTTVSNVTNNTTNTTNTATTESLGGGETTKEIGTSTTVNISFEGTNIIDESSEDRFIRKIATQLKTLGSKSISV